MVALLSDPKRYGRATSGITPDTFGKVVNGTYSTPGKMSGTDDMYYSLLEWIISTFLVGSLLLIHETKAYFLNVVVHSGRLRDACLETPTKTILWDLIIFAKKNNYLDLCMNEPPFTFNNKHCL